MSTILKAENISKQYRLGLVGTGTLKHDFSRFMARLRGKEDPFLKVGAENDRSVVATEQYVWALRDINFEVRRGEVLGIIGKNGAGKSTLLKILSRVTSPTTGVIKTNGRIASLLEVGTGFHPELTGRENIYLNGAILGMSKAEIHAKEEEIIDFSGCAMYIDTPVKRYSSGMRVRLAFAVAAHLEPDILVIDEVLAVGDAEFQKKAIGKMQDISKGEGRTVLFVSHNMGSIKSLCTRAIVLNNGMVAFDGETDDAIDFYLSKNKQNSSELLKDRKDRTGNGNLFFNEINILSENGNAKSELLSGDTYNIQFDFSVKKAISNVFFRVRFLDSKGRIRFLCNSYFVENESLSLTKGEDKKAEFIVEHFPLPTGSYNLQVTCFSEEGIEDDIENAAEFSILGGDFYRTGREQVSKEGVLVHHSFKILQS